MTATESARIHATLGHPVIDTDAHWMESMVVMTDYVRGIVKGLGGTKQITAKQGYWISE